jgi:beta-carotene hydroxylase
MRDTLHKKRPQQEAPEKSFRRLTEIASIPTFQGMSFSQALGLRFAADIRTVFAAFVMFPLVPLVQYFQPQLLGWMLPVSLYFGFLAGVLTHNQNHCPTFKNRTANTLYQAWLSMFYGYPTFGWVPSHNQNHHKFVNRAGDASITWRYSKRHTWTVAWTYFFISSYFQGKTIAEYKDKVKATNPELYRSIQLQYLFVVAGHGGMLTLALAMHGLWFGLLVYGVAFLLPSLFALWSMFFINYIQHVHCDPWSEYNHSRNFVGRLGNWMVFNNGLHAAHHKVAGLHWSKLPALHADLAPHIHPDLQQASIIGFCLRTYVLGLFSDRFRTHQIGRPAWDHPEDTQLDLTIGSVDGTDVGVNASMA